MIKIDKSIAVTKPIKGRPSKFPWQKMEVGDSFAIPAIGRAPQNNHVKGMKFTYRKQIEDGVEVYRIWRIK